MIEIQTRRVEEINKQADPNNLKAYGAYRPYLDIGSDGLVTRYPQKHVVGEEQG